VPLRAGHENGHFFRREIQVFESYRFH
jgi:hypothetical protein